MPSMYSRRLKTGYFILEGLNSAATVYFLYYIYFYMEKVFGFGNKANLCLAALNGATYALLAWKGGRFAQRFGYFTALKIGLGVMAGAWRWARNCTPLRPKFLSRWLWSRACVLPGPRWKPW